MVAEQTRLLIEEEFREVFGPSHRTNKSSSESVDDKEGYSLEQMTSYDIYDNRNEEEEKESILPR